MTRSEKETQAMMCLANANVQHADMHNRPCRPVNHQPAEASCDGQESAAGDSIFCVSLSIEDYALSFPRA